MGAGLHRMPVHLQGRVDHVHIGDVCRDQRVNQRVVGYRNRCPPPEPPHELAAGDRVGDPDVQFVQRHRRRGPGRPGLRQRVRIAGHVVPNGRVRARAGPPRRTPTTSSTAVRPGGSRLDAPPRSARRTPASPCIRRGRPPRPRAGTADACWWAAGPIRRFGTPRPGSARRTDRRTRACLPGRWPGPIHVSSSPPGCSSSSFSSARLIEPVPSTRRAGRYRPCEPQPLGEHPGGVVAECRRGHRRRVVAVDRHGQARRQVFADSGLVQRGEHRVGRHPFVVDHFGEGAVPLPQDGRRRQRVGHLRGGVRGEPLGEQSGQRVAVPVSLALVGEVGVERLGQVRQRPSSFR